MDPWNRAEYDTLRSELQKIKECTTTYIGFVLGGSGVAFYFLAKNIVEPSATAGAGLAAAALSLVASAVLLVLMYKFVSHNRYAGYCKLLTHERVTSPVIGPLTGSASPPEAQAYPTPIQPGANFFAWEICMDRLRDADIDSSDVMRTCRKMNLRGISRLVVERRIQEYTNPICFLARWSRWTARGFLGWLLLVRVTVTGRVASDSWRYPGFIVPAFLVLIAALVGYAWYAISGATSLDHPRLSLGVLYTVTAVQGILWCHFAFRLYNLMNGADRVDAFCWRFVPIRYAFIRENVVPRAFVYGIIGARRRTRRRGLFSSIIRWVRTRKC